MNVQCGTCGRSFELDQRRVGDLAVAKCLCGARLYLHEHQASDGLPRRLGKYILISRIAVGGMGEIYYGKISGAEGFEREVAIKKMLEHLSQDRDFIDMMVKEAKLTVLLNHPNIVQVYDLAKEGAGYYIAMEYVPGCTVGTILEKARKGGYMLPVEVAVYIVMQVLRGLSYAHALPGPDGETMTILHRDITPQNILVTRHAWVKITDFGIARALNEISTTSPGMLKGKLGYLAPEQLEGKVPDRGVDIFCAGILLWEMLTIRRLFKGESEIDTFRMISEAEIPPLGNHRNDVSPQLEAVVRKALARDRTVRYQTADAFYDGLISAIFPKTADDFRVATQAFFNARDELFQKAENPVDAQQAADITSRFARAEQVDESTITEVRSLLLKPPGRPVKWPLLVALTVVFALFAALVSVFVVSGDKTTVAYEAPPPQKPALLSSLEVRNALMAESERIKACYERESKALEGLENLEVQLSIVGDGAIKDLSFVPSVPESVGSCLEGVIRQVRFRAHPTPLFSTSVALPSPRESVSPPPPEKTPAPSPRGGGGGNVRAIRGQEIQSAVQKQSAAILACLESLPNNSGVSEVRAQIHIETSGRVLRVSFEPEIDAKVTECLSKSFKKMRFRRQARSFTATIPIKLLR